MPIEVTYLQPITAGTNYPIYIEGTRGVEKHTMKVNVVFTDFKMTTNTTITAQAPITLRPGETVTTLIKPENCQDQTNLFLRDMSFGDFTNPSDPATYVDYIKVGFNPYNIDSISGSAVITITATTEALVGFESTGAFSLADHSHCGVGWVSMYFKIVQ